VRISKIDLRRFTLQLASGQSYKQLSFAARQEGCIDSPPTVSSCPDRIDDKTSNEDLTKPLIYLMAPEAIAAMFRAARPPVIGRIRGRRPSCST